MKVGDIVIRKSWPNEGYVGIITKEHWHFDDEEVEFEIISFVSGKVETWYEYDLEVINESR